MLNGTDRDRLTALLPGPLPRSARTEPLAKGSLLRWDTVERQVTVVVSVTDSNTGASVRAAVSDGREVWTWRVGLPVKTAPIVSGNTLYVLDYDGNLHALTCRT